MTGTPHHPASASAERILLNSSVDYAGLFPPAALAMDEAVRNYAEYRAGDAAWILGRFICPSSALEQFSRDAAPYLPSGPGAIPWRLSVTGSGDLAADLRAMTAFNARHSTDVDDVGAVADAIEVRAASVAEIETIDALTPRELITFIEIPVVTDPAALLAAIAQTRRHPKIRMGGTTPSAFPESAHVVRFLAQCAVLGLSAKATAGLHHPLRGSFRLTYDDNAVVAPMFGFMNVFLAVALLASGGGTEDATRLLEEYDPRSIVVKHDCIVWSADGRSRVFDRALLQQVRTRSLLSFGSCSFLEPVAESRTLGLL